MTMNRWFSSTFGLVLALSTSTLTSYSVQAQLDVDADTQCACPFAEHREQDCFMYGASPDGGSSLVAYPRAPDACITDIGAENGYMSSLKFWIYCPHPNHTDYNLEEFTILVRQETETEQAQYVMSLFIDDMDFEIFAKDPQTSLYRLPEKITNNLQGIEVDCAMQENECWNQVKAQMRNRTPRWDIICRAWHDRMIPEFYAEQGVARRMLCEGGFNETQLQYCKELNDILSERSNCGALENQVRAQQSGVPLCNETRVGNGSGGIETSLMTSVVVFLGLPLLGMIL